MQPKKEGDYSTSGWFQITKVQPVTKTTLAVTVRDLQGKGKGRVKGMRTLANRVVEDQNLIISSDLIRQHMDGSFPAAKFHVTLAEEHGVPL